MNGAMQMTCEKLLRMERNHTKVMSVMRQMTDERFGHVTMEMRDIGQYYRALLQASQWRSGIPGKQPSEMEHEQNINDPR